MTKQEWLAKATEHKEKLRGLVETYHPAARTARRQTRQAANLAEFLPITAPAAEMACENVREVIAARERNRAAPGERFDKALAEGDWLEIDSLLNSAWFGVPESTACWGIEGFKKAVDLIEDPPEDEQETGSSNSGADFRDDEDERDRGYDDDPAS